MAPTTTTTSVCLFENLALFVTLYDWRLFESMVATEGEDVYARTARPPPGPMLTKGIVANVGFVLFFDASGLHTLHVAEGWK
jgi:hypothetical protein